MYRAASVSGYAGWLRRSLLAGGLSFPACTPELYTRDASFCSAPSQLQPRSEVGVPAIVSPVVVAESESVIVLRWHSTSVFDGYVKARIVKRDRLCPSPLTGSRLTFSTPATHRESGST